MAVVTGRRNTGGAAIRPLRENEATFLAALAAEVGADRLSGWLEAGVEITVDTANTDTANTDTAHIRVAAAGSSFVDWIRREFRLPILAVSQRVLGRELPIAFEVVDAARVHRVAWSSPAVDGTAASALTTQLHAAHGVKPPHVASPASPASVRRGRPFGTFATFVVGESNRIAATLLEHLVAEPGAMTPFYLHGGPGVGKTHLLEATWSAARQHPSRKPAVFMTAEQFTSSFIASLRHGGVSSFRAKFRGVSMLLLDDITFLAGKRETQNEFLSTFDDLLGQGVQVVVAGSVPLKDLTMLRPEIVARLEGGMNCEIKPPTEDTSTLCGIVQQMARQRGMDVSAEVGHEIVACVAPGLAKGGARHLSGALHQIQAAMLCDTKRCDCAAIQLDVAFVRRILGASAATTTAIAVTVRIGDIEAAVCEAFGLQRDALRSSSRAKSVTQPRMLAMWLARKHTRFALSEIGSFFGNRSHSTVLAAQKRVQEWLTSEVSAAAQPSAAKLSVRFLPLLPGRGISLAAVIEQIERALKVSR